MKLIRFRITSSLGIALGVFIANAAPGAGLSGSVQAGGKQLAEATVTLFAAGAAAPTKLGETRTDENGRFTLDVGQAPSDSVLYIVAKRSGDDAARLLAVVGSMPSRTVTVNEFTTVASVWTSAQFLEGDVLSGHQLGLHIAAGNVPNFADLETGEYGNTIQDALNSSQTPTMANFATLANVLAGALTQATPDAMRRFLAAATPRNGKTPTDTLSALEGVARDAGYKPERLFALLDAFYPVPKGKNLRPTPFMPYLTWAPSAWTLPLKFTGSERSRQDDD